MSMSEATLKEAVEAVRVRYLNGSRETKCEILNVLSEASGRHRKHLIRLLNERVRRMVVGSPRAAAGVRGRRSKYGDDQAFCTALRTLWLGTDQMCAPNLKAAIPDWLPSFRLEHAMTEEVAEKLREVSAATIGRILQPSASRSKWRVGTKTASL